MGAGDRVCARCSGSRSGANDRRLVAVFALAPPLLSLDVFSYVSYARLETVHGLNPYENPPSSVPGDPAVPFVADFRDQVSVYGPLFTLLSLPLGGLGVGAAGLVAEGARRGVRSRDRLLASRLAARAAPTPGRRRRWSR